jgi:hypothetical protein
MAIVLDTLSPAQRALMDVRGGMIKSPAVIVDHTDTSGSGRQSKKSRGYKAMQKASRRHNLKRK